MWYIPHAWSIQYKLTLQICNFYSFTTTNFINGPIWYLTAHVTESLHLEIYQVVGHDTRKGTLPHHSDPYGEFAPTTRFLYQNSAETMLEDLRASGTFSASDRLQFPFEPSIGSESDPETGPHPENFGLGLDWSRATSKCWWYVFTVIVPKSLSLKLANLLPLAFWCLGCNGQPTKLCLGGFFGSWFSLSKKFPGSSRTYERNQGWKQGERLVPGR